MEYPIEKELLLEAVATFGKSVVREVVYVVEVSDPDGACTHFEDEGLEEHAECVRFLYFEE